MDSYLPQIQDQLRRDYPRFDIVVSQELQLGPELRVSTGTNWLFANKAKSEAVVLSQSFVTLMASTYDTFDVFSEKLERVLAVVGEAADLDLCERLGLRYIDLIRLAPGEGWADYLAPGLLGPPTESIEAEKFLYRFEGRAKTAIGELRIKTFQSDDGRFLPPDLSPTELDYGVVLDPEEIVTILDTDHFSLAPRDFDAVAIVEEMWALHDKIDIAFRSAVTPIALERWGANANS